MVPLSDDWFLPRRAQTRASVQDAPPGDTCAAAREGMHAWTCEGWGQASPPVRSQACRAVRLTVTPVLSRVTGSVMRVLEMGQKNSRGGPVGQAMECRRLRVGVSVLKCCRLTSRFFLQQEQVARKCQFMLLSIATYFCKAKGGALDAHDGQRECLQ